MQKMFVNPRLVLFKEKKYDCNIYVVFNNIHHLVRMCNNDINVFYINLSKKYYTIGHAYIYNLL